MRHLLLLLSLLLVPVAGAQQEEGHVHEAVMEPALVPTALPEVVAGEVKTARFRIVHTKRAAGAARALAERIEGVRDTFVGVLGRDWPGVTELRVGVGREEFEALALPGGKPPGWAAALAYPRHGIVLLDALTQSGPEGETTLRHELAHVALGRIGEGWPRWFQEGMAQHLTQERFAVTHYAALFRAVAQEHVFRFQDIEDGWPEQPLDVEVAYAQSADFIGWLSGRHGSEAMGRLLDGVSAGEPFPMAFGKAFHSSLGVEEGAWREGLALRYGWLPLTTSTSLMWLGATGLFLVAYWRRRRQKELRLAELEAEEVAEEAALRMLEAEHAHDGELPPGYEEDPLPEWRREATLPDELYADDEELEEDDEGRPTKPTLH